MLKLSAALAACATSYAAFSLYEAADFEAGNINENYSLCAALSLLTCTLIISAMPNFPKALIALRIFSTISLIVGIAAAWAAWSIPNAGATDMLGIVALMIALPILGIFSVATVLLAVSGLVVNLIAAKKQNN